MYVCAACLTDPDLSDLIKREATEKECSFCGRVSRHPISADLEIVTDRMLACLGRDFGEPGDEGVGWDGREGGWQLPTVWDTYDLLTDKLQLELPNDHDSKLLTELCSALGDQEWCYRNPYSMSEDEHLDSSWRSFCEFVKHQRRYFFLKPMRTSSTYYREYEPLEPEEMLEQLANLSRESGLLSRLAAGTVVWRGRPQPPGDTYRTAKDLGPPSKDDAKQANRMSAPGISIFYGAMEAKTAFAEVRRGRKRTYAVGAFELCRPVWTLDLTILPPVPGLFCADDTLAAQRPARRFLRSFVWDVSKSIARDERVHIDYVPTQVVTEYFRVHVQHEGEPVSAVIYPSAKDRKGRCIALFAEPKDVSDDPCTLESLLTLKKVSVRTR
jgi:hypothetical protein